MMRNERDDNPTRGSAPEDPANLRNLPEPRDERLEALLDEALAPEAIEGGIPAGLTERILARTEPVLRARSTGVLARIGPLRLGAAIAAILVVALGLSVWATLNRMTSNVAPGSGQGEWIASNPSGAIPQPPPETQLSTDQLEREVTADLRRVDRTADPEPIDQDLTALDARIDEARGGPWDPLAAERWISDLSLQLDEARGGEPIY